MISGIVNNVKKRGGEIMFSKDLKNMSDFAKMYKVGHSIQVLFKSLEFYC